MHKARPNGLYQPFTIIQQDQTWMQLPSGRRLARRLVVCCQRFILIEQIHASAVISRVKGGWL
jgi:hypothetical protein